MDRLPLTARGSGAVLLAVASFVAAQAFGIPALLLFSTFLVCVVAAALASLHLGGSGERVVRSFSPETATVGDEVIVQARVEARSVVPTPPGRWQDRLPEGVEGPASGPFPSLPSALRRGPEAVDIRYRVMPRRRGIRPFGPLVVRTTDPFGFARRVRQVDGPVPLTVAPALIDLPSLAELRGGAGGTLLSTSEHRGQGADNLEPRAYLPGDSMRRIHWRASAHRGELMVRQEEQESTPEATVVFDRTVDRWSDAALLHPGDDPAFELAVSACASAVERLVRAGYTVTVIDVDGAALGPIIQAGDTAAVEALTISFAPITARRDGAFTDLVRVCAGESLGPLVLVTGNLEPADAVILGPVAHHSSVPVLLSVEGGTEPLETARRRGWRVARLEPEDDLTDLWQAVQATTEASDAA